jgi:4-hydroxy-tetrahydrodipicolinate synthase
MLPSTVRLANDFANVVAKSCGRYGTSNATIKKQTRRFSGDDMIALPMVLAGGAGVISVIGSRFSQRILK